MDAFAGMLLHVREPGSDVCGLSVRMYIHTHAHTQSQLLSSLLTIERPFICDIIDQKDSHRTPIVGGGDRSESLLSGCIPYLQFHTLAI